MGTISATEINKEVLEFTQVRMAVSGSIELVQSDTNRVLLKVLAGNPKHLEIGVRNGVLYVIRASAMNLGLWQRRLQVEGEIHYVSIDTLSTTGSGRLIASHLDAPKLTLEVRGSGDIDIGTIDTSELAIKVSGSGDVIVDQGVFDHISAVLRGSGDIEIAQGSTSSSDVQLSGSGDYQAENLNSKDAAVSIRGSGDAAISASESLDVAITGSGNVTYLGTPKVVSKIVGSGKLITE